MCGFAVVEEVLLPPIDYREHKGRYGQWGGVFDLQVEGIGLRGHFLLVLV